MSVVFLLTAYLCTKKEKNLLENSLFAWILQDEEDRPSRRYDDEDEADDDNGGDDANGDEEQDEEIRDDTVRAEDSWDAVSDGNDRNELNPEDGLQDLQFFPNFYRLLKSLDSGTQNDKQHNTVQQKT